MEGAVSSSDRDEFGSVSSNLGRVKTGLDDGISKSIDWYATTISSAGILGGTFGLGGIIIIDKSNGSAVVELKKNITFLLFSVTK